MSPLPVEPLVSDDVNTSDDEAALAAAAPKQASPAPTLTYDPEAVRGQISRRQFRFLMALTLVNTLMLGAFIAGPALSKLVGGWHQDYKRWRANRESAKQAKILRDNFIADYQKLLAHAQPPDKIVYEEDPDRAAKLASSTQYVVERAGGNFVYLTPKPWQFPVTAQPPAELARMSMNSGLRDAPLFVGARKTPSGREYLVVLALDVDMSSRLANPQDPTAPQTRRYEFRTQRSILAAAFQPHATDTTLLTPATRVLLIDQTTDRQTIVSWTKTTSWENGRIDIQHAQLMRFFAGQPDPADPTHFTLRYEMNGQPGLIDGWLRDDGSVALEPRQGRITKSDPAGKARIWNPHAEPPPPPTTARSSP